MDRYTQNANESLHAQCSQGTVEQHQLSVDSELQKIEQKILSENDWTDEYRSHVPPISASHYISITKGESGCIQYTVKRLGVLDRKDGV